MTMKRPRFQRKIKKILMYWEDQTYFTAMKRINPLNQDMLLETSRACHEQIMDQVWEQSTLCRRVVFRAEYLIIRSFNPQRHYMVGVEHTDAFMRLRQAMWARTILHVPELFQTVANQIKEEAKR